MALNEEMKKKIFPHDHSDADKYAGKLVIGKDYHYLYSGILVGKSESDNKVFILSSDSVIGRLTEKEKLTKEDKYSYFVLNFRVVDEPVNNVLHDKLFRFFASISIQDQPISVQREYVELMREWKKNFYQ